jgi:hypothetical protein
MASRGAWVVVAGAVVAMIGCSGGATGPKTAPVKGKITYKKLPVEGATVSFLGDGKVPPAVAVTDAAGQYILTTTRSGDGAVPGVHKVTVTKIVAPPAAAKPKSGSMSMEDAAKAAQEAPAKPVSLLPERYASAETSGLQFTVKDGTNDIPIDLTE